MDFAGRTILVTGAGSGLGRSLALRLGQQGATVACADYDEALLQQTIALLEKQSTTCSAHVADVSDSDAVARLVDQVDARHDGFDVLINNAGIMQSFTEVCELAIEEMERVTQVNYWGTVMLVKASLPVLMRRPEAMIVNIASMGALMPFPGQAAYSASKAAVRIFSEGLRMELEGSGIEVALVMPGAMRTGIAQNSPFSSEDFKAQMREVAERPGPGLDPDRAARKILSALARGRRRILLGADAWLLDKCYRIAPVTTSRLLRWAMRYSPVEVQSGAKS